MYLRLVFPLLGRDGRGVTGSIYGKKCKHACFLRDCKKLFQYWKPTQSPDDSAEFSELSCMPTRSKQY